jgi:signal recognition particle receptor subunit beta
VPGQVIHASTRRLVVQGADGIAFIADSRESETQNNADSFLDLKDNLKEHGLTLRRMPLVIQFNKRDLPGVRSDDEIAELASQGREPVYLAVATQGAGVVESFLGLLHVTWTALDEAHDLTRKFNFDAGKFLSDVTLKLGQTNGITEILKSSVGGTALGQSRKAAP